MLLREIAVIAAIAAVVTYLISIVHQRRQIAAKARALGCERPVNAEPWDPSGVTNAVAGIRAAHRKEFPDFMEDKLAKISQKEGRLVSTVKVPLLFFETAYFTTDPQNIQTILALKFKEFGLGVGRTDNFHPLLGNGIFATNGKQWEHSRALLRPQFVRSQVSDLRLEEEHVQSLFKVIDSYRVPSANGWTRSIDLLPLFFRLTLDSATEFLFGESINSQLQEAAERTTASMSAAFAKAFDGAQNTLGIGARIGSGYWMVHTAEFRRDVATVHTFVDYFVQKALARGHAEKPEASEKEGESYVFLNALAEQTQDPEELRSQILNILLAGRDTTASSLGWFFYTMALPRHTKTYQRLRAIVLDTFGTYSNPTNITYETMKNCQYLQWCLNEILRLYPVVPMNGRTAQVDTTLPTGGGVDGKSPIYVRKGQDVGYSVHLMHRRKDLWGADADEFRAERWEKRKPGWDYLPFNGGPRICIGQQFALTELAYVIIRMMQRIDNVEGSNMGPVKHGLTLTNCPGEGVNVRLHLAE